MKPNDLRNIEDVVIDMSLPVNERIIDYIKQINDPYHFLVNGIEVNISFADTNVTLEDSLTLLAKNLA